MPRIIFSTVTPNDQGGIIPNNVIDFSRFNKNPVCLTEHKWNEDPIGMWSDVKEVDGKWGGVPIFHALTEASRTKKDLYDGGWIRAASIGGQAIWEENAAGQFKLDADGNRICKKFYLYEISIVTLPSNEDAVQEENIKLAAKIYGADELENINQSIATLSSKFNSQNMKKEEGTTEVKTSTASENTTILTAEGSENFTMKASELPGFMEKIIKSVFSPLASMFKAEHSENIAAPAPKGTPESTQQKKKDITTPQPTPTGLGAKAEKAKAELDKTKEAAEKATEKVKKAKELAEKEGASEEDMAAHKAAMQEADDAMKACESAQSAYDAASKKDDEEDEDDEDDEKEKNKSKKGAQKTTNSAMKPVMKTTEEIKEELKLASAPTHRAKVISINKTFTQLAASKDQNDINLLGRVLAKDGGAKEIGEYAAVLNSILADGKLSAIAEKTRIMMNVNENSLGSFQNNPKMRAGISLHQLSAQLNSGAIEMMGRDNTMKTVTTLSSTDNALASPALNTIEWLSLAIFKLFPNSSWKNEIPVFGAEMTGKNTGIIWANITADPTIYKGNQPVNPASYSYSDQAVALALTPYWLQPMIWNPLTMHQLRYDQMGTGWAQAFAKWNAVIDDNLIYTLASTVPQGSIVKSSGLSGIAVNPLTFNINGANDPNAFYYNPAFVGSLKRPVLNDIIVSEQIYNRQNFELASERPTLVIDPTMDALLAMDPETKSLLTRWINQDGGEFTKFKNTLLPQRSRVAIYDPATSQVKDPNGAIPGTAVSAALGFIPSQVGIGLGMLDVFMIQDPTSYGYKMSADIRMGIVPLRSDFAGTSLLTYGAPNV